MEANLNQILHKQTVVVYMGVETNKLYTDLKPRPPNKLTLTSLSCAELGPAQPQLVCHYKFT